MNAGFEMSAIEGGDAGGGSARQASERRSIIARLGREADWLESVAADQRATAALLATLSDEWSVLHDLQWADSEAPRSTDGKRQAPHLLDHLVAGPGGLFAIVTRRFTVPITSQDGELWVGDSTLAGELVAVVSASQSLANALGTPVAPVMGFHGDTLPADAPAALQGVLLCPVDDVATVIERFPHTMLMPHERASLVEQLVPLMISPGTSTRHQQARPAAAPPAQATPNPEPAAARPPEPVLAPAVPDGGADVRRRWPLVLLVLLLVAAVIGGGLWWFLGSSAGDSSMIGGPDTSSAATIQAGDDSTSAVSGDLAGSVPAPALTVSLVCPSEGEGWQIVPDWPGDLAELSSYDIELLGDDGGWTHLTLLESRDLSVAALSAQPPKVTFTMRATAVMLDMSRAEGSPVEVATPAEAC